MTAFVKEELLRLVDRIPQTDPTTAEYHILLRSIEYLDAIGSTIDAIVTEASEEMRKDRDAEKQTVEEQTAKVIEIAKAVAKAEPEPEPTPKEEATPEPKAELTGANKVWSAAEVRKALVEAKGAGVDVKGLLLSVGVDSFPALPAARYAELMARLAEAQAV